ncbi:cytochrome P450 [uncultured Thiodictyon sp.]|uniref:cytochrome P450 n=1 Tax=uncultured Thiodictyon sp. TaxID=1846217 RepID=UPI0025D296AC|nr:cytochrome P450 [uncultured Thiodictyon sp.]
MGLNITGFITNFAGRLAILSPHLARAAARLLGNPLRLLVGKPVERQLLIYQLPQARLALVNDLAIADTLLADRAGTFPKSAALELLLRPLVGSGVFGQPGGDTVKQARRSYVRALSRIPEAEVTRITRDLTRQYLADWQRRGAAVPIPSELSRLTIDVVTTATLGTCFTPAESQRFIELFFAYHQRANPLLVLLGPLTPTACQQAVADMGLAAIGADMRALIANRFLAPLMAAAPGACSTPFAAALLETVGLPGDDGTRLAQDPAKQTAVLDELAVMLLAGHETTASVLSWLLWELSGTPAEQDTAARLLAEHAADAPAREAVPNPAQQRLGALIQEALRLYPPIAFLLRDTTTDVVFREKPIPAGSFMVVSPWTIQRHRALWADPDTFDPTRWLAAAPPPAMAQRTAFIPFGQGPRVCPGKRFAEVEMYAILDELLGAWRLTRSSGRAPTPLGSLTTRPDYDFGLLIAPREH